MECEAHPQNQAISRCRDCGRPFCSECARDTGQTQLCPSCYGKHYPEMITEYEERVTSAEVDFAGEKGGAGISVEKETFVTQIPSVGAEDVTGSAESLVGAGRKHHEDDLEEDPPENASEEKRRGLGRFALFSRLRKKRGEERRDVSDTEQERIIFEEEPDYDFSILKDEGEEKKAPFAVSEGSRGGKEPSVIETEAKEAVSYPEKAPRGEDIDALLQDVLPSLVDDSVVARVGEAAESSEVIAPLVGDERGAESERARLRELEEQARREERRKRREERWGFLAQPRSQESTFIAFTKPKAALFIFFALMLGALLWALPNAFLIPKDTEYVVHAVIIGIVIGLLFWWKAGKKHGTKLAVQASLTTLFSLILGELLHWIFVVLGTSAFRKVFFDLISFKFLWNRSVLSAVGSAMYPVSYLWILIPASLVAFIIGFGMPPIPEIFAQLWGALIRREGTEESQRKDR